MLPNVGTPDRVVRILIGIAMILLAAFGKVPVWVGWLGLVPLVTGVIRICPLYWVLGIGRD
ncbi:YgaP family membrane protein [Ralstonia sp. R-29]|uniref:YgaP family membrane protein n=1 Tax=Ralstonia sp. R-29 TaxID=3404059 RepID=UPI003CE909D1